MSQATHPHEMDAVPAVPATSARAPVRRARFTVLDETGRSPDEADSGLPKIVAVLAGAGLIALGGFFLRGSGTPELKETRAAPAAPVAAAAVSDPSRTQAAWAKEQANLKPAAKGAQASPAAAAPVAEAANPDKAPATSPAPVTSENAAANVAAKAATPARSAADNSYAAAPIKRQRKASDNPYADPPAQRAAASDNPY